MLLRSVESSMIQAVGYDEDAKTLQVVFNSGKSYQYQEVPKTVYQELLQAASKGSYMRQAIIDCYPYQITTRRK